MSSTTSSASSGPDRPFGSSDPMDPQELGLTYIQGASTDSGIDTPPVATPPAPPLSVGEEEEEEEEEGYRKAVAAAAAPDRALACQGVALATISGSPRDGSLGSRSGSSSLSRYRQAGGGRRPVSMTITSFWNYARHPVAVDINY